MSDAGLFTNCNFHGREFLLKMYSSNTSLELLVTDKKTGEEWQCNYDNLYIENLTHKTGNYKQFDIFVAMIKSGLLKTSSSISLDLLTLEDLESLRVKRLRGHFTCSHSSLSQNQNRRYLIVTYNVEFDRINYPIPLEYCGPPDPTILQGTIKKLEEEIEILRNRKGGNDDYQKNFVLEKRNEDLNEENRQLKDEIKRLRKSMGKNQKNEIYTLQKAITNLEKSIMSERKSHHKLVEKLRNEKQFLIGEIEKMKMTEKQLKKQLRNLQINGKSTKSYNTKHSEPIQVLYQRSQSPSTIKNPTLKNVNMPNTKNRSRSNKRNDVSRSSSVSSNNYGSRSCSPSGCNSNKFRGKETRSRSNSVSSVESNSGKKSKSAGSTRKLTKNGLVISQSQNNELDFEILEERIHVLQKLLNENIKFY